LARLPAEHSGIWGRHVNLSNQGGQSNLLTEAFNVNLEELVTKDFLAARFAELKADFDVKFRVLTVMVGIVLAAVVLPLLERLVLL